MRLISKIVAAIVFLFLGFLALTPLGAGLDENVGATVAIVGAAVIALVVFVAPTGRRAWGRGFLLNGALFVAMPLLVLPLLGRAFGETVGNATSTAASAAELAGAQIGAGIGVAAMFGAFTFVGTILGFVFLVFGLVLSLGGRREVIVVEGPGRR